MDWNVKKQIVDQLRSGLPFWCPYRPWFSYEETKLGQGRDAVKKMINDNPELMEEIENKILDKSPD